METFALLIDMPTGNVWFSTGVTGRTPAQVLVLSDNLSQSSSE